MENYKKKKLSVYGIFAIIFGAIGALCFIYNLIIFTRAIVYYAQLGIPFSQLLNEFILPSFYQIAEPLATFGGMSLLLFAVNKIIKNLPCKCDENITEPTAVVDSAEPTEM